jgi:hypothetical protein
MALEGGFGCVSELPCKSLVLHGNLLTRKWLFTVIGVNRLPRDFVDTYLRSIT